MQLRVDDFQIRSRWYTIYKFTELTTPPGLLMQILRQKLILKNLINLFIVKSYFGLLVLFILSAETLVRYLLISRIRRYNIR